MGKKIAITIVLIFIGLFFGSRWTQKEASPLFEKVEVLRVIDGDTIEIQNKSQQLFKVRLIGVDTPETKHPQKGVEYYGKEAAAYTTELLESKFVYLEKDVSEVDRYDRLLRYVWLDLPKNQENPSVQDIQNKMFNAILLSEGYAQLATFPPDVKYIETFRVLETTSRNENKGLFNKDTDSK